MFLEATVVQIESDSSTYEITCKLNRRTAGNDNDLTIRPLSSWRVKRKFRDFQKCLQYFKTLKNEELIPITTLGLLSPDITEISLFVKYLVSLKNIPSLGQDLLTTDFYDYQFDDALTDNLLNSSYRRKLFILYSFAWSSLFASSVVIFNFAALVVAVAVYAFRQPLIQTGYELVHFLHYQLAIYGSHMRTVIQTVLILSTILATFHRVLGYIVSLYVRNLLGYTRENGKFDINIDWISLRLGWDKNQVVVSGIVWKNVPRFKSTPCFIRINEIALTVSTSFLYRTIMAKGKIEDSVVIDEVVIDTVHVYIEKTNRKEDGLNIWAALGAENPEEEKKVSGGILAILNSAGNMTVGALSSTASAGIAVASAGADLGLKAVSATANAGITVVHATASAGLTAVSATADVGLKALSTTKDIGSSIGSTLFSTTSFLGITKKVESTGTPTATPTVTPVKSTDAKEGDIDTVTEDDEEEDEANSPWRDVGDAHEVEESETKELTLEINRVLVFDLQLHVSNLFLTLFYNNNILQFLFAN